MLRVSAALAAATATVGAAVMRRWDVEAGKRVADLTRARVSDEWRYEEQVAEWETDLEESHALRQKLEHKLRAKRAELASLRTEHAALLRRYATAETERASILEGRRLLAIEASTAPDSVRALPAGSGGRGTGVRGTGVRAGACEGEAVAVAPETPRRRQATEGGFDFFGTHKSADALVAVQNEDLADVVGQEALALHKAESEAQFKPFKPADEDSRGAGQVIDLMAHDETEQIDVQGLRNAVS